MNIDSSGSGFPHVSISFNDAGAKLFDEVTMANVKKRLAVVLGQHIIYSAPEIKERIGGGNAQISGSFSLEEARDFAIVLKAGALPAPVRCFAEHYSRAVSSAQTLLSREEGGKL